MEGGEQWGRVHKVYNWFGLATGHGKCIIYRRDPIAFHLASRPDVPLSNANGVEARSPGLVRGTRTTLGSPVVAGTTATRLWRLQPRTHGSVKLKVEIPWKRPPGARETLPSVPMEREDMLKDFVS